jgi:hypothetical protein
LRHLQPTPKGIHPEYRFVAPHDLFVRLVVEQEFSPALLPTPINSTQLAIPDIGEYDLALIAAIHDMVENRWGLLKLARPMSRGGGLRSSMLALVPSRILPRLG